MTTARLLIGVAAATLVGLGPRATAQVALPEGPNRERISRTIVDTGGRSREEWDGTIDAMTSFGLSITPAERALVLEYLATYLPFPPR